MNCVYGFLAFGTQQGTGGRGDTNRGGGASSILLLLLLFCCRLWDKSGFGGSGLGRCSGSGL